jgi:hypothetical protein
MTTGVRNMITPDGKQPAPKGFNGDAGVNVPWGVSIDGDDDVWFGNFWGRGVGLMAGADPKNHTAVGAKTGDLIHIFQSGSIQMITDVCIDPAGNVWAARAQRYPLRWPCLDTPEPALSSEPLAFGRPSPGQTAFIAAAQASGCPCAIAVGIDEAIEQLAPCGVIMAAPRDCAPW